MTSIRSNNPLFVDRARAIARKTVEGDYDVLLACRDLADVREEIPSIPDELMDVFVGVASEIDGLPIGHEREHWAEEALKSKDRQVMEYRERVSVGIIETLETLLRILGSEPSGDSL
jgi:hypothetical protein